MSQIETSSESRDRSWIILGNALLAVAALAYLTTVSHRDRLPAVNAATLVSVVSAVVSLSIIQRGFRRSPDAIAGTFIVSWLLRSAISIGGCVAAIVWLGIPATTTLLVMTLYYFATLSAETFLAVQRLQTIPPRKVS